MSVNDENAAVGRAGPRIGADLWPRVAAAVAMGIAALAAAWTGGVVFAGFWFIASAIVLWEWQRLIHQTRTFERVAAGVAVLAIAGLLALNQQGVCATAALLIGAAAVGWIADPSARIWAGVGMVYAGALVVSLALLRSSPGYGLAAILWLFAVVWGADVAAYFAGRLIGGPKLWPSVSPGKTWSGAIVGALAGAVLGLLMAAWTNRIDRLFELGLATAIVSQFGDLFESALKRRFGVKDSSALIPGHGGLMDRLDGFIAASAFAALVAAVNTRGSYLASGLFQW
jgi:phosphatidate cytidylyltransferase